MSRPLTRRSFLQLLGVSSATALSCRTLDRPAATSQRPNVLLIYSDDQGTLDLPCYGSEDLCTPHLEALARQGVRFTQFYAASSVCSPSRAALLTGKCPQRAGVPGNAESHPSQFGQGRGLADEQVTIAERLRGAGYRTGHFGKWHLGAVPGPNGQGFDESFGFLGGCIDKWSHFSYGRESWGAPPKWHDWYHNGEEVWESGTHSGDLTVREASRFIAENAEGPFFAYVAFGMPHYPVQPYNKYMRQYAHLEEPRRSYAAALSTMDEQIGRLLAKLDELGIRDNTLVIFESDQGHSTEARTNYGGGNAGPYRGAKASLFEAGIRIPAIVSMPGTLPQGAVRGQFCVNCDWFPTIAELCGAQSIPSDLDGRNLLPVILSADASATHRLWHWQLGKQWAVREGDWKLLVDVRDTTDGRNVFTLEEPFLANLAEDPSERTNFASKHPDIVQHLTQLHEGWERDATASP